MKYITTTISKKSVNVKAWDNENKCFARLNYSFTGELNDAVKRNARKLYDAIGYTVCKFYDDTVEVFKTSKYKMCEDDFYNNAVVMEKRPNGEYISRTATATKCEVLLYNNYTDDTETRIAVKTGKNMEKIAKEIAKDYKNTDYIILDINPVDTITALYVMSLDDFIAKGIKE